MGDPSRDHASEPTAELSASTAPQSATAPPTESLSTRFRRLLRVLGSSTVEWRPYDADRDGPLTTFQPPPAEREIDRYWVNEPYAFIAITTGDTASEYTYHAVEPDLTSFETTLLERIQRDIRPALRYRDVASERDILRSELADLLAQYGLSVDMRTFHALWYYLDRDFRGYGRLDPLLADSNVEDISCDGYDRPVFLYHESYADIETNIVFSESELDDFVVSLAQQSGNHISVADPMVEATLADGSRAELTLGETVTPHGSAFTIRQYATEPLTPVELLQSGTFNADQLAYFWLCLEHNKSILFAGGTAAGKTTSLNAISMFIPPGAKLISIEDTRELSLAHDNWLAELTREQRNDDTDITMYELLRSALRHRPEYLLVGEVRGREAKTLFQAMNTGHTTLSTIHADSIETVVNRLENEPINVPRPMVDSLDILSVQTQCRTDGQRLRRANTIGELRGIDSRTGELDYASVFEWESTTDSFSKTESELTDDIRATRGWSRSQLRQELHNRADFLRLLEARGITDYREFSTFVAAYYADSDAILTQLAAAAGEEATATPALDSPSATALTTEQETAFADGSAPTRTDK